MTRIKAFAIHMFASGCFLAAFYFLVNLLWYPGKLFSAAAGSELMHLLIGVDLILGPLLTLIIFNPQKKKLKQDMLIIVLCQLGFLMYGVWSIYTVRPVYIAFVENRFYMARANEIDPVDAERAKFSEFKKIPRLGPVFVGTVAPEDQKMRNDLVFGSLVGMGLQNLPEYFVPLQNVQSQVRAAAKTSRQIVDADSKHRLEQYEYNHRSMQVGFIPLLQKGHLLFVAVDTRTGAVLEII